MCKISVRIIPNSSRTHIVDLCDGTLKIRIMEPAEGNRANEALVKFLSKKLKIKTICIVSGIRARSKVLDFGNDFTIEQILDRLLRK
ncbi:MAG: DUF167 domain-containing protein [Puniceicoccales bacterium]|jgi:uncharacterized protein (TIGR00251 family)|nr:DUF167 domain-containing protein [Puniceicoccales bacterium]